MWIEIDRNACTEFSKYWDFPKINLTILYYKTKTLHQFLNFASCTSYIHYEVLTLIVFLHGEYENLSSSQSWRLYKIDQI